MERLTKRNEQNTEYYYPKCFEKCEGNGNSENCNSCELEDMICEKLGRYEDLEEQGLLLRIPCKLGDTVYCIMTGLSYKNPSIFKMKFGYELIKHFGKRVFLTKEEAEASLHMQGENTVNQDNHIKND